MSKSNAYYEVQLDAERLPIDHIRIRELAGKESISQLFAFDIDILTLDGAELEPGEWLGESVSLVFTREPRGGEVRRLHGMIASMEYLFEAEAPYRSYRLRLVPHAFRLTLVEMQEIFLDLSVPEIIKEKVEAVGLEMELRLTGDYPKLPFVVQYKETDLAFVSRLAEHVGISFSFEHTSGMDLMVFTDHPDAFRHIEGDHTLLHRTRGEEIDVYRFALRSQMIPANYLECDYNHSLPRLSLEARYREPAGYAGGVVEYGANYRAPAEGEALARVRAQERDCTREVYLGQSDACAMSAGGKFSLDGPHTTPPELLLVEVEHRAVQSVLLEGGKGDRPYSNVFRAIDAARHYRPPRRTPKPRIAGLLPALIEPQADGELGQYAQLDPEGAYTIRFFFDLSERSPSGRSSLPVRMLQPHAGTNYGLHFPLKPGIEVYVGFVEGDPDRPLIVGAAPNPITASPVTRTNAIMNRLETASGVFLEIRDI